MDDDKDTTIRRLRHELADLQSRVASEMFLPLHIQPIPPEPFAAKSCTRCHGRGFVAIDADHVVACNHGADLQSRLPVVWEGVRVYPQSGSAPAEFRVPSDIGEVARLAGLRARMFGLDLDDEVALVAAAVSESRSRGGGSNVEIGARLESIKARARMAGLDPDDVVKRAAAAVAESRSRGDFYAEANAIITDALALFEKLLKLPVTVSRPQEPTMAMAAAACLPRGQLAALAGSADPAGYAMSMARGTGINAFQTSAWHQIHDALVSGALAVRDAEPLCASCGGAGEQEGPDPFQPSCPACDGDGRVAQDQPLVTPHEIERLRSDALEVNDHETAALVMRAMSRGDLEALGRCEALVQTMRPLWAAIDEGRSAEVAEQTRANAVTRLAEERHALACAAAMLVGVSIAPVVFKSGRKWCVRSGRLVLDRDFESEADAQAFVDAARRGVALARRILGMGSE